MRHFTTSILLALALLLSGSYASADWSVNSEKSSVKFISIKKNTIAETHHFNKFSGKLTKNGQFDFSIDLASVETLIPIRNERMLKHLFETEKFATASLKASLDSKQLKSLLAGKQAAVEIPFELNLHGKSKSLKAKVVVRKIDSKTVSVISAEPLVINAADFDLVAGIATLQKLAGLNAIATAVPVSFNLELKK